MTEDIRALGRHSVLNIAVGDAKSGLRRVSVSITQGNRTQVISDRHYNAKTQHRDTLLLPIDSTALKLQDGPALLTIAATDQSLWSNTSSVSKTMDAEIVPPQIFLLTPTNYVSPGGTGMILYRTSKPVHTTGVFVDDIPFAAYPTTLSGKACYIVFFAMPIDNGSDRGRIRIVARDAGGNEATAVVPRLVLKKKFRNDKMALSDHFLQQKMPEFIAQNPALRDKTPIDIFVYVNSELRGKNNRTIEEIARKSGAKQLWQDTFLRMKDASPMAQFGDRRLWLYRGRPIGESVHMGVDLASTAKAPIEAANTGIIAFTGALGIYGNTVIIDHGQGLQTLYAHLSDIQVQNGQSIKRGEVIGHSGLSGLAGGDHLHFSMVVGGKFVNPTEWWDAHWIADNVTKKIPASF